VSTITYYSTKNPKLAKTTKKPNGSSRSSLLRDLRDCAATVDNDLIGLELVEPLIMSSSASETRNRGRIPPWGGHSNTATAEMTGKS
jgi:hypothetical protein